MPRKRLVKRNIRVSYIRQGEAYSPGDGLRVLASVIARRYLIDVGVKHRTRIEPDITDHK